MEGTLAIEKSNFLMEPEDTLFSSQALHGPSALGHAGPGARYWETSDDPASFSAGSVKSIDTDVRDRRDERVQEEVEAEVQIAWGGEEKRKKMNHLG